MYKKKTFTIGDYIEVIKYHTYPQRKGSRAKKEAPTKEAVQAYNDRQRVKKVQRMILANFKEGDFHLTLSYKQEERPASMADAKKELQKFNRKMSEACRKLGREWKAIWVTERGKKGGCHHHLIVENFLEVMELTRKYWTHGHSDWSPLYEDGAYEQLAQYIVKKETKEENEGCCYSHTRNLIIPQPQIEVIHSARWQREPKTVKGYEIIKDSIINGENPITGYPYQTYMMKKVKDAKKRKR